MASDEDEAAIGTDASGRGETAVMGDDLID
jgi:hypothetical protein